MFILKTFIVGFIPALVVSFSPRRLSYPFSKKISQSNSSATTTNVSPGRTSVFQLASSKPFAIVVDAEIVPDRRDEFLDLIEKDAVGSRGEPGCLRFGKWWVGGLDKTFETYYLVYYLLLLTYL